MNPESMHICCNIDDAYAQHCGVMLTSLFDHCLGAKFEIHILISQLSETNRKFLNQVVSQNQSVCRFYHVNSEQLRNFKYAEGRRKLSEATYYRLFIGSVLNNSISKVLYLDSDMIIQQDISPLFSIDLKGYALAATKDLVKMTDEYRFELSLPHGAPYFCAGMMVINLDYWRETKAEQDLIEFAMKERKFKNHDQDALNAVFRGKWFMLSAKWSRFFPYNYENSFFENSNDKKEFAKNPAIIHFFDLFKPWNKITWYGRSWLRYRKQYYRYLKSTPWKNFKPEKFLVEKYTKYGLYKFLFVYSLKTTFSDFNYLVRKFLKRLEYIFFLPFLVSLKIFSFTKKTFTG